MGTLAAALRDRVNYPVYDEHEYMHQADELMLAAADMLDEAEKALEKLLGSGFITLCRDEGLNEARAILAKLREHR